MLYTKFIADVSIHGSKCAGDYINYGPIFVDFKFDFDTRCLWQDCVFKIRKKKVSAFARSNLPACSASFLASSEYKPFA